MRAALIDIGSNTIKMKIYDVDKGFLKEVYSEVKNTKLISYISDRKLSQDGIILLCKTVSELKASALNIGFDVFKCFATASLRRTENADEIINTVYGFCNERIDLISGEQEAHLSFTGVKKTMPNFPENGILIDMGGGSTEIVSFKNTEKTNSFSMSFGSLSLYIEHFDKGFDHIKNYASETLRQYTHNDTKTTDAILVGGTALAIYKLYKLFFNEEDLTMRYDALSELFDKLKTNTPEIQNLLLRHVPDRTTTVIPGLAAYMGIFEEYGISKIHVTTNGIREGYLLENVICKL